MAKLTTAKRERLPASQYACPIDRKLPINDAMARFDQVITTDCHPAEAKSRILAAARKFGIDAEEFQKVRSFKKETK